ncbi:hypothetical protein [Rubritalea tangerina]|uniref:Fibronectin type-III domain-containing protein n=1 Tax=Rubritalea tangerina TaxID=430798 RepID=A0ABW4Z9V9_9BACT
MKTLYCILAFFSLFSVSIICATPTVTTNPATTVTDLNVTLNGSVQVNSIGQWLCDFEYGETNELGATEFGTPYYIEGAAAGNDTINTSLNLKTKPNTTYYFRLRLRDMDNDLTATYGDIHSFTTQVASTVPSVTILPHLTPVPITHEAAELRSDIFSGSSFCKVYLQYGLSPEILDKEAALEALISPNETRESRIYISELTPSTQYYYRWVGSNAEGSTYSDVSSFTTTAAPTIEPTPATSVVADSAVVHATVSRNGGLFPFIYLEYGETTDYGKTINIGNLYDAEGVASISQQLTNLKSDTTYHYRFYTQQNQKRTTVYSQDLTFTTRVDGEAPTFLGQSQSIPGVSHSHVTSTSLFSGTADTILKVEYGTTNSFGNVQQLDNQLEGFTTHLDTQIRIPELTPETEYFYRFVASNAAGTTYSDTESFTTLAPPTIINNGVESLGSYSSKVSATFTNFGNTASPGVEWGTTQEYGSSKELYKISGATTSTQTANIGAEPSTTYHYRFYIFDGTNYHYSENKTLTSAPIPLLPNLSDVKIRDIPFGVFNNPYRKQISSDSAQMTVWLHPGASDTTLTLQYGLTNSLGQRSHEISHLAAGSDTELKYVELFNLQPETTYFWRFKATNAHGTVYSDIQSFQTHSDPLTVSDTPISVTDSSATLVGKITPDLWHYDLDFVFGTSPELTETIEQTSPDYVYGVYDGIVDISTRNVTAPVAGLQPNTTYYYKLRAKTNHFFPPTYFYGALRSFTTSAPSTLPTITQGLGLLNKTDNSAQVILGGFRSNSSDASVTFEYGKTSSFGSEFIHPETFPAYTSQSPNAELTGLEPNTLYHVRAKVTNAAGSKYTAPLLFTTHPPGNAPSFSGQPLTDTVGTNSATLLGGLLNTGDADTVITFEYGTDNSYGSEITLQLDGNLTTTPQAGVTSLQSGTTYYFRAKATNIYGSAISPEASFTTAFSPQAETLGTSDITDITATLHSEFSPNNVFGFMYLKWGESSVDENEASLGNTGNNEASIIARSYTLTGLKPNTSYKYRAVFRDRYGMLYHGDEKSFTTPDPATLPSIIGTPYTTELSQTATKIQVEGVNAGGSAATLSVEYGTTSNYGLVATLTETTPAGQNGDKPTIQLENLTANTLYYARFKVSNNQGITYSEQITFSTNFEISTLAATDLTHHEVTFNGSINPAGQQLKAFFQWKPESSQNFYSSSIHTELDGFSSASLDLHNQGFPSSSTYTYRIAATDQGGFTHYGNEQSFTLDPLPTSPSILGDISISSQPTYNAASFRSRTISAGDQETTLIAEYGKNNSFDQTLEIKTLIPNQTTSISFNLTNLDPNSEYQVRLRAQSSLGADTSNVVTFSTKANPVLAVLPASGVADHSATMNATLIPNGGSVSRARIIYGTEGLFNRTIYSPTYTSNPDTGEFVLSHNLTNLIPSTVYNYKLVIDNFETEIMYFTTNPASTLPSINSPITIVSSYVSSSTPGAPRQRLNLSDTKVRIDSGQISSGSTNAQVYLQFGTTTSYGNEVSLGTAPTYYNNSSFTKVLENLSPNTKYHLRIKASNEQGTTFSEDFSFTTYATPTLSINSVTQITDTSALVNATVDPKGRLLSVRASFKQTSDATYNYSASSSKPVNSPTTLYLFIDKNLEPEKDYQVRLSTSDDFNSYYSNEETFTTLIANTPPRITGQLLVSDISNERAALSFTNSTDTIVFTGSSDTSVSFEYGTDETFSSSYNYPSAYAPGQKISSLSTLHLSNLTANTTYFVRLKAQNAQGITYSTPTQFTTLPPILVKTGEASEITEFSAKITGEINRMLPEGVSSPTTRTYIEWGITESLGSTTSFSWSPTTLTNLTPGTQYYYRLKSKYFYDTQYHYGSVKSFTTLPATSLPSHGDRPEWHGLKRFFV